MFGSYNEEACITSVLFAVIYAYSFLNLLIRGTELLIAILSTCFMIAPLLSGNSLAFHGFLNEESLTVLWSGHPINFTHVHGPSGATAPELPLSLPPFQNPEQFRVNLHVWTGHLLWKIIIFIYSTLLVVGARKRSYTLSLLWFAFAIPVLCQSVLHLLMDLVMSDFFFHPIQKQILKCLNVSFQMVGVILLIFFLRELQMREDNIREIDRYNNNIYKRDSISSPTDGITITQVTLNSGNNETH